MSRERQGGGARNVWGLRKTVSDDSPRFRLGPCCVHWAEPADASGRPGDSRADRLSPDTPLVRHRGRHAGRECTQRRVGLPRRRRPGRRRANRRPPDLRGRSDSDPLPGRLGHRRSRDLDRRHSRPVRAPDMDPPALSRHGHHSAAPGVPRGRHRRVLADGRVPKRSAPTEGQAMTRRVQIPALSVVLDGLRGLGRSLARCSAARQLGLSASAGPAGTLRASLSHLAGSAHFLV